MTLIIVQGGWSVGPDNILSFDLGADGDMLTDGETEAISGLG